MATEPDPSQTPPDPPPPPWGPWLGRAREDMAVAETLLAAESPAWAVCYHVQQAVEKGLKGLLVVAGGRRWCSDAVRSPPSRLGSRRPPAPLIPGTELTETHYSWRTATVCGRGGTCPLLGGPRPIHVRREHASEPPVALSPVWHAIPPIAPAVRQLRRPRPPARTGEVVLDLTPDELRAALHEGATDTIAANPTRAR